MEFHQRDKRDVSVCPWRTGISARIDSRERGEAILAYSFPCAHGIPVGLEGRGQTPQWKWEWEGREAIASSGTQERLKNMAHLRLLSASYVGIMLLVGAILQGVVQ